MTTVSFKCSKSGEFFLPHEGGQCDVCKKLFLREYLVKWNFEDGVHMICIDDVLKLDMDPKDK